jgi:hypothetical protein
MARIRVRSGPKMLFSSLFVTANLMAQTFAADGRQPYAAQGTAQPVYTAAFDQAFNQGANSPQGYGYYPASQATMQPTPAPVPEAQVSTDMTGDPLLAGEYFGDSGNLALPHPGAFIDNALPFTHLRVRYDANYDVPFADRAEFLFAKNGALAPDALGLPLPETNVDYQEATAYLEYAIANEFSVFIEAPYREINPDINQNTSGLGDINLGFKTVLRQYGGEFLTFQTRLYTSSGSAQDGLGTGHVSVEPALLYSRQFGNDGWVFAELRDWIPIEGADDFEGNVLRYSLGYGHVVFETCDHAKRITPVVEAVGWSVLSGKQSNNGIVTDAEDQTIVNINAGIRFSCNGGVEVCPSECGGFDETTSFYIGYGRAVTGNFWAEDLMRLEFRVLF